MQDENITHILSSDLSRAHDTAKIIKSIIDPSDTLAIETTHLLREAFFGDIQGQPRQGISGLIYGIESSTGESADELYKRADQALSLIKAIDTPGDILVVGHGSFSSVIFATNAGKSPADLIDYRKQWSFGNGEVQEMELAADYVN